MLIGMFLEPGTIKPELRLYRGQGFIQVVLLGLAGICVPWLLVTKPYLAWRELQNKQGQGYMSLGHAEGNADDIPHHTPGISLADEEEGHGQALLQAHEEEGVSSYRFNRFKIWKFMIYDIG